MAKIVLIGSDRIGLARVRDILVRAGNGVEMATDLSDAKILARAISADILVIEVNDTIVADLSLVEELAKSELDLEVVLLLPPMSPPVEQELITATESMGVKLHVPRQMSKTPFFTSVINLLADRRRLRQAHKRLGGGTEVIRTIQSSRPAQGSLIPDFDYLEKRLTELLQAGAGLCLMVVGIDDLAEIEEKRGQRGVEQFMSDLANFLLTDLRDTDFVTSTPDVGKLAVVLPGASAAHARLVVNRIQAKVMRHSLGTVAVSTGIAEAGEGVDAQELIRLADEAWQSALQAEDKLFVLTPVADKDDRET